MALSLGTIAEGSLDVEAAAAAGSAGTAAEITAIESGGSYTASTSSGSLLGGVKSLAGNMAASYLVGQIFARSTNIAHPDVQTFLGNGYSSLDQIPAVYGSRRIGGSRAMLGVRSNPGEANDALLLVLIWGEGEFSALKTIYFDGVAASDENGTPSGFYRIYWNGKHHLGADDQPADGKIIGDVSDPSIWNSSCTLSGIAYTSLVLGWRPESFPNGRPTVTVDCLGRKVYDPRTGLTGYSANPALVIRDYMTNPRFGAAVPAANIDDAAIIIAANYCDELIDGPNSKVTALTLDAAGTGYTVGDVIILAGGIATLAATVIVDTVDVNGVILTWHLAEVGSYTTTNPTFSQASVTTHLLGDDGNGNLVYTAGSGATFKNATFSFIAFRRYSCDGVVNIENSPLSNVRDLLSCCRGFLVFSGGQYRLRIDKPETPVAFVLSEDNIVGGWSIQGGSKRTRFNRLKARFFNEDGGWLPDLAVEDSEVYRAQDGGLVLEGPELELPYTTNPYRALQMTRIELKRSRVGLRVSLVATMAATVLEVGDVVPLSHATPGWPAASDPVEGKLFRVVEIEILFTDEVRLSLVEYSADVYTLDPLSVIPARPLTSLPDALVVPLPGAPMVVEDLYSTSAGGAVKSRATVTWGAAASVWVQQGGYYELEYRLTATGPSGPWIRQSLLSVTELVIEDLLPSVYDFRVRAVNILSARSGYSPVSTFEIFGLTAPPSDPTGFAVQAYEGKARFSWARPQAAHDLDVLEGGRVLIRWSPLTTGADWNAGSLVNPDGYPGNSTTADGPLMTGTYLIKFKDSTGNYSTNAASFVMTEALLTGLSTLVTVTEHPTFSGAKTNVAAVDFALQLDGSTMWDALGPLDLEGYVDSAGGVSASGTYAFATRMDLGSVKDCRLFLTLRSAAFDTADPIDSRTDDIDDWGLIDGAIVEDVDATVMVRATLGDPNALPTWGPWHALGFVADYHARGFEFRVDLVSGSPTHNRRIDQLSVTAKQ